MQIFLGLNPDGGTVYREALRQSGTRFVLMSYDRTNPGSQNQLDSFLRLLGASTPSPQTSQQGALNHEHD